MTNYLKECWYCHSSDLRLYPTHVQCQACGATWNQVAQHHHVDTGESPGQMLSRRITRLQRQDQLRSIHTYGTTTAMQQTIMGSPP